ncbi:MAG: 50S ribosomal protein L9 [Planctomycetes bacterium]|nr:50S ribosomal protein L9 [Planctomycetota bacterium]
MANKVEVLLRENLKNLGKCGEVVGVAPGYARNYLLPRKLAMQATEENIKAMSKRRVRLDVEEAKQTAEIVAKVQAISAVALTTKMKADEHGHLYGSLNAALVVELLGVRGWKIEEKAVKLDAPIKSVGEHKVKIHVHAEYDAEVTITVASDAPAAETPAEAPSA